MKTAKKVTVLILLGLVLAGFAPREASLWYSEDFSAFSGAGFDANPWLGALDSDEWRVTGLSDGDGVFGGRHVLGDFARGTSPGGAYTGGVYGFEVAPGDRALGIQPTGTDFTPGAITLRLENTSGETVTAVQVSYSVWVNNDENRSSTFGFAYSVNDSAYTSVPAHNLIVPGTGAGTVQWVETAQTVTVPGLALAPGDYFYLRWAGNDLGGSGGRDEIAVDDIVVQPVTPTAVKLVRFQPGEGTGWMGVLVLAAALGVMWSAWRKRFAICMRKGYDRRHV